jgi:hypothetical protein
MAKGKAAIAIGLGAAAAAIAALAGGGVVQAAESETPPKATPKPSNRVALARKFAKLFKIPRSLILAVILAQSGNKANAYRANKRGGAWGYGQMTLATATDIYPSVKAKLGKTWDGTGQGLLDPTINIGLTAYYLSLWWKRYQRNPRNWMLAAYAYVLGPGRVRKVVPNDSTSKLPASLPADFAKVKTRFISALKSMDVKRALAEESVIPNTSGVSGDPLVWTPSAVKAEFDRIRNVLDTINKEMSQAVTDKKMSGDEWSQWYQVYKTGHDFVDTASTYWGSNVVVARQHEQNAGKWRDIIKGRGAKMTGPSDLVKQPEQGLLDKLTGPGLNNFSAAIAVGGIIGVGVLILAVKK